jgi:hypothetical protein
MELGSESSTSVYAQIQRQIVYTKLRGLLRQRLMVETWEPAVKAHCPDGTSGSGTCRRCAQQWPCQFLTNLLEGGLLAPSQHSWDPHERL